MSLLFVAAGITGAYLLAVRPSRRRDWLKDYQGVYFAHRGLYHNENGIPENSMAAFRRAVENGYGVELDVQITKDEVPVIFHDDRLKRMAREENGVPAEGVISDYTLEELRRFHLLDTAERIPTLAEFLKLADGRVPLIVELKVPPKGQVEKLCEKADELLSQYSGKYVVESFHPFAVRWYERHRPEIIRGQLSEAFTKKREYRKPSFFACEHLLFNFMTRPDFIAYNSRHYRNLSRRIARRLYHVPSVAWTIQSEEELKAMRNQYDLFIFEAFEPGKKTDH